jgi:serine/threonine protein kinase
MLGAMADDIHSILHPGTVIAGRYEVVKRIGTGSMGHVYVCRHRELPGHLVATKVLFPDVAADRIASTRFRNEVLASYKLSHPNVVRAYEFINDGDLVAYTMEYVGGGDLANRLSDPSNLIPIPEVVRVLSEMCLGVQAIHDAGIVHRDLKPENILLTESGAVKIGDFGIARTGQSRGLTEHGGVVGTIDYVSPEYMMDSKVDWRSDIYAIGILGYEMVTGDSPFRGESVIASMKKRLVADPAPPSSLRPECPKELDAIVLKAMTRNPEERYQAAADMFSDLMALNLGVKLSPSSYLNVAREREAAAGPTHNEGQYDKIGTDSAKTQLIDPPVVNKIEPSAVSSQGFDRQVEAGPSVSGEYEAKPDDQDQFGYVYPRGMSHARPSSASSQIAPRLDGWAPVRDNNQQARSPNASGAFHSNRMRALAKRRELEARSLWLDIATGVVAVLIGLGLGFGVVRLINTDFLKGAKKSGTTLDIRALDDNYR